MAYKDKELQRQTTKERVRRYRALHKGVTSSDNSPEVDVSDVCPQYGLSNDVDADGNPMPDYD